MVANPDWAHLGRVVKEYRESHDWTQVQVAGRDGPSDTRLGDIEAGKWRVTRPSGMLTKLDKGLQWGEGTSQRVLYEGYDPTVGGDAQDGGYVKRADPTAREPTSEEDSAVLRAIREMQEDIRALSGRVERLEQNT